MKGKIRTTVDVINESNRNGLKFMTLDIIHNLMFEYASQFAYVKTTCGKDILFDIEDYHILRNHTLFLDKYGNILTVWKTKNLKRTSAPVAKLLLKRDGKTILKYKDGNKLNIKKSNLEVITHQIAHYKEKISKNNSTGYKGVSFKSHAKKYEAYIKIDNKKIHLGYFSKSIDAAKEYNKAAIEKFGSDYVHLNIL
jgi:hypothetical protein